MRNKGKGKGPLGPLMLLKMLEELFQGAQGKQEEEEEDDDMEFTQENINPDGLDQETINFEKNGVKTTVILTFLPNGYPAGAAFKIVNDDEPVTKEGKLSKLEKELAEALDNEDYKLAAEKKAEIESLNK